MIGSFELGTLVLVASGVVLLALAARRASALITITRRTAFAGTWKVLRGLMIGFIGAYVTVAMLVVYGASAVLAVAAGLIMAAGGLFVYLVTRSSHLSMVALVGESVGRRHVTDVLNALSDGIVILDRHGVITAVNRPMVALSGDPSTLVGTSAAELVGLAAESFGRSVGRLREGMLQRRQGPAIPVSVQFVEVQSEDGDQTAGLLVVRDRRELVGRELQLESAVKTVEAALRARHQLAAMLAAEMHPRLVVLRDTLDALAEADADRLALARETLTGLELTLASVADAETLRDGVRRALNIPAFLRRTCASLASAAPAVHFDVVIGSNVSVYRLGHEPALRDALVGAAQFLLGTIEPTMLRVAVECVPGDPERLAFSVASVGEQRVCMSAPVAGVGLDLAAARLIVHTLGGTLTLHGGVGSATEVSFTAVLPPAELGQVGVVTPIEGWPLARFAELADRSLPHSRISTIEPRGTALVVDDSPPARELLVHLLRELGYQVEAVATGRECVERATRGPVDLVLVDLVLPDISGIEVITTLREHETSARAAIVVVSSIEETRSVAMCLERGADDYLSKPVNPTILRARLQSIHENRVLTRQATRQVARLEEEIQRADGLLRAILPGPVADELQTTGKVLARRHVNVVVLFADIVGFTAYCEGRRPEDVLVALQGLVNTFEALCRHHGVLKIKTVGDALMAGGGLLDDSDDATQRCVELGFALIDATAQHPAGWSLRVGLHRGPVVAGIVGAQQFSYDIWGDTVNTAQRIEHHGVAGEVCVSDAVRRALPPAFATRSAGISDVKGKGPLEVFVVSRASAQHLAAAEDPRIAG